MKKFIFNIFLFFLFIEFKKKAFPVFKRIESSNVYIKLIIMKYYE